MLPGGAIHVRQFTDIYVATLDLVCCAVSGSHCWSFRGLLECYASTHTGQVVADGRWCIYRGVAQMERYCPSIFEF